MEYYRRTHRGARRWQREASAPRKRRLDPIMGAGRGRGLVAPKRPSPRPSLRTILRRSARQNGLRAGRDLLERERRGLASCAGFRLPRRLAKGHGGRGPEDAPPSFGAADRGARIAIAPWIKPRKRRKSDDARPSPDALCLAGAQSPRRAN